MSTTKAKTYADNKKRALHKKNVNDLKAELNELGAPSQWILNAQPTQIETLQKLLKTALKVSKREEQMIKLGLLTNEVITDAREPDAQLLEALGQMKAIEKKRLKYNNRKWEFNVAVIAARPESIAAALPSCASDLAYTLDVFRDSIDISKYSPTASDYKRAAKKEEKESADELFGLSKKEMFAAPKSKTKPPPLPKSKPPPIPVEFRVPEAKPEKAKKARKAKPKPEKAKKPTPKPVELEEVTSDDDDDDELEAEIAALKAADAEIPVTKSQFRSLFLDHFGDTLDDAAALDPVEERTDEICEDFLRQCKEWKAVGSSAGLGRYARKSPKQALKVIRELYIDGADEFLDPDADGVW